MNHAKYLVITNADILPIILSYTDRYSLLSSTLVSHLFNTVATKILYSHVNLKTVKHVDAFLNTLDRTAHHILYNTVHTNEYLVNCIRSITLNSPNLAYLSGEKLSKCISECKKLKEVIIGSCTLSRSIVMAITQLERLNILKFKRCSIIDDKILNYLVSGISSDSDLNMSDTTNVVTTITTTTTTSAPNTSNTNKLKNIITKKILHTHSGNSTTVISSEKKLSTIHNYIYTSKLTRLTHLTIDIQPPCSSQLLISLIQQNADNIKSLDLLFQGLDQSLLTIIQYSYNLEYLTITEKYHLSEQTIIQLIKNCFSTSVITPVHCKLKKLSIDYGPFSEKFLLSLSNLCKTQRKISITLQPEIDYNGFDLIFTNDSLEILLNRCEDIEHVLLNFYLNINVDNGTKTSTNGIEELILDGIKIFSDSLNIICEKFDFIILKLQNIPISNITGSLTKNDILKSIILLPNLKYLFITEKLQNTNNDDGKNFKNYKNRLEQLNYDDFYELAEHCPNLVQIYWNHKKFIDKFKIPSKFIQVVDNHIWKNF
ncbi:hypothetical protein C1645_816610 [Glomus cerebriforme]|uniref:Uncharacterized protein n=1 Tax=Glomus cerebriforme TaxID=658196 RepID=A0A397TGE6_9GLOM|nr:hypothetical protein C1645_816610 [Glomus cerebriforme]